MNFLIDGKWRNKIEGGENCNGDYDEAILETTNQTLQEIFSLLKKGNILPKKNDIDLDVDGYIGFGYLNLNKNLNFYPLDTRYHKYNSPIIQEGKRIIDEKGEPINTYHQINGENYTLCYTFKYEIDGITLIVHYLENGECIIEIGGKKYKSNSDEIFKFLKGKGTFFPQYSETKEGKIILASLERLRERIQEEKEYDEFRT